MVQDRASSMHAHSSRRLNRAQLHHMQRKLLLSMHQQAAAVRAKCASGVSLTLAVRFSWVADSSSVNGGSRHISGCAKWAWQADLVGAVVVGASVAHCGCSANLTVARCIGNAISCAGAALKEGGLAIGAPECRSSQEVSNT
jgi:hypothetical protein